MVPSVTFDSFGLKFAKGSPFDNLISRGSSLSQAQEKGYFYKSGNEKYVNKQIFMNENFPYWLFIKIASVN